MALTVLFAALALHVAAVCLSVRLAWTSRKLAWTALALATVLLALWRLSVAYDALQYDIVIDLGTEILAAVIALLIIVGMRTARLAHAAVRRSEGRIRTVVESAQDAIVVLDGAGKILYANPAVAHVFGFAPQSLLQKPFRLLAPSDDLAASSDGRFGTSGGTLQLRGRHQSGRSLALEVTFGEHEEDGRSLRTGILRDVTAREELQEQLRRSEERYLLAARGANDGLWDWHLERGEVFYSQRFQHMLGLAEHDECSTPAAWFGRIHAEDGERVRRELCAHLDGKSENFECEYRILHADGSYRWMLCRGLAVRDDAGTAYRIAGSQTDITSRKQAEERLLHDALHDSLTGLPNRALLLERLGRCLHEVRSRADVHSAVLFVDLDRFKNVNDSLGHQRGDDLLVEVGRKLKSSVRPTDTVARFGGDEFAILLEELDDDRSARDVADRVLADLSESIWLGDHELVTTASIGIVPLVPSYECPGEVLRDADAAMYRAKELGKARAELFDSRMRELAAARLSREADLRRAIERGQLDVAYQPLVWLSTGRVAGFEALARWELEEGPVPPAEFIPLAEETGLIVAVERLVIARACAELSRWQKRFPLETPLSLSVNLSGRHLRDPAVVEFLQDVLERTQPAPGSVRLEITESLLLSDDEATSVLLERLRELGFKLVIDDFGTGYSSLSYLHRLPIDAVKLDRSFIHQMESAPERSAIVNTVVALAKQLSLVVVAEGVETTAELERLRRSGCDLAQGFLFSRPLPAPAAHDFLERDESDSRGAETRRRRRRMPKPRLVA